MFETFRKKQNSMETMVADYRAAVGKVQELQAKIDEAEEKWRHGELTQDQLVSETIVHKTAQAAYERASTDIRSRFEEAVTKQLEESRAEMATRRIELLAEAETAYSQAGRLFGELTNLLGGLPSPFASLLERGMVELYDNISRRYPDGGHGVTAFSEGMLMAEPGRNFRGELQELNPPSNPPDHARKAKVLVSRMLDKPAQGYTGGCFGLGPTA